MPYKLYKIACPLSELDIYIFVGSSTDFDKWFVGKFKIENDINLKDYNGYSYMMDHSEHGTMCIIWLNETDKDKMVLTLVHEMLHVAFNIYDFIGAGINLKDNEAFIYYYQSLLEKALSKLNA